MISAQTNPYTLPVWDFSKKESKAFAAYVADFAASMAEGCECEDWALIKASENTEDVRMLRRLFCAGVTVTDAITLFCDWDMTAPIL